MSDVMSVYLVPIALTLGLIGLAAFLWAMRSGQFEDLEGAGGIAQPCGHVDG